MFHRTKEKENMILCLTIKARVDRDHSHLILSDERGRLVSFPLARLCGVCCYTTIPYHPGGERWKLISVNKVLGDGDGNTPAWCMNSAFKAFKTQTKPSVVWNYLKLTHQGTWMLWITCLVLVFLYFRTPGNVVNFTRKAGQRGQLGVVSYVFNVWLTFLIPRAQRLHPSSRSAVLIVHAVWAQSQ